MKYAKDALRVGCNSWTFGCNRAIKLEFHGAKVSSDAGLFPYRDLDEAGALLTVSAYANPDYWTYWPTQRVLAWTGGMLVLGGIT